MNYNKKNIRDIDVAGKKILMRCDFNVPYDKKTGEILDDTRIIATIPTIRYLLEQNAAVILTSHLGRPKGEWKKENSLYSAREHLEKLMGIPVPMTTDVLGPNTKEMAAALQPGQVMLVENLRFRKEEEKNDPEFSKELASLADIFVFDAFGCSHRAHASTAGVADYMPAVAGFLVEKELAVMGGALENPQRPLVSILGGAKVADKIGVINNLLNIADTIIIGGGMAYTFQKALGGDIGESLLDEDRLNYARNMVALAKEKGVKLLLPVDNKITKEFSGDAEYQVVTAGQIPDGWMGMDIGPKTVELFSEAIKGAGTVIWNGPMGVFEFDAFAQGTNAVAKALADLEGAITIVGGGDSASAVEKSGLADKISHISTGGGASLEFLEGLALPGVVCLNDK
ncbi:MAG: phosphoglycerate kinase [Ruminiclostridium sp.]|nr:phosphoglycerate kinase [Ruminiclostridium sp.]